MDSRDQNEVSVSGGTATETHRLEGSASKPVWVSLGEVGDFDLLTWTTCLGFHLPGPSSVGSTDFSFVLSKSLGAGTS